MGRTNSLTDIVKLTLLKNSVSLVPELHAVQTTADQLKTAPGNALQTYDQYCTLLISATTTYDDNIKRSSGVPRPSLRIYQHELNEQQGYLQNQHEYDVTHMEEFDVNTSLADIASYQSYAANSAPFPKRDTHSLIFHLPYMRTWTRSHALVGGKLILHIGKQLSNSLICALIIPLLLHLHCRIGILF